MKLSLRRHSARVLWAAIFLSALAHATNNRAVAEDPISNNYTPRTVPWFFVKTKKGFDDLLEQAQQEIENNSGARTGQVLKSAVSRGAAEDVVEGLAFFAYIASNARYDQGAKERLTQEINSTKQFAERAAEAMKRWLDKEQFVAELNQKLQAYRPSNENEAALQNELRDLVSRVQSHFNGLTPDSVEPLLECEQLQSIDDVIGLISQSVRHLTDVINKRVERENLLQVEEKLQGHLNSLRTAASESYAQSDRKTQRSDLGSIAEAKGFRHKLLGVAYSLPLSNHLVFQIGSVTLIATNVVTQQELSVNGRPRTVVEFRFAVVTSAEGKSADGVATVIKGLIPDIRAHLSTQVTQKQGDIVALQRKVQDWSGVHRSDETRKILVETRAVGKQSISDPPDNRHTKQISDDIVDLKDEIATRIQELTAKVLREFKSKL